MVIESPPAAPPSVAVIGAGAIGAFFGAQLAARGCDLRFFARRAFNTLRIESCSASFLAPVRCFTDPCDLPGDASDVAPWVLLAVKTYQTQSAVPWLTRLCTDATTVVILQNGVENRRAVVSEVGRSRVVEPVVYCGAELTAPGRVRHTGPARLVVRDDMSGRDVRRLFDRTSVEVLLSEDFVTERWRKLLTNIAANGITALTRQRLGVLGRPDIAVLVRRLLAEALPIARAEGADLSSDDLERIVVGLSAPAAAEVSPSMLQDRLAGRATEHEAIYGAVVRAGVRHCVPAPLHQAFTALLAAGDPASAAGP